MSLFSTPVYPIPPFFNKHQQLYIPHVIKYVDYLIDNGVKAVMTTVGTSGFNLLNKHEIRLLNSTIDEICGKEVSFIVGLPPGTVSQTQRFLVKQDIGDDNRYFMAIYPDRYYNGNEVVDYFSDLNKEVDKLFIHGLHIRKGVGGGYRDYDGELIYKILSACPNVVGMKEETSSLMPSEEMVSTAVKSRNDFEIIVAGGSCKRFMYTKQFGATNFLSGLGSLFPQYDNLFFEYINDEGGFDSYKDLNNITLIEQKLFHITKKAGWHPCMREGIAYLLNFDYYARKPFPYINTSISTELYNFIGSLNK